MSSVKRFFLGLVVVLTTGSMLYADAPRPSEGCPPLICPVTGLPIFPGTCPTFVPCNPCKPAAPNLPPLIGPCGFIIPNKPYPKGPQCNSETTPATNIKEPVLPSAE
jgi:hypothetical protein